jgi:hypothetical protein
VRPIAPSVGGCGCANLVPQSPAPTAAGALPLALDTISCHFTSPSFAHTHTHTHTSVQLKIYIAALHERVHV